MSHSVRIGNVLTVVSRVLDLLPRVKNIFKKKNHTQQKTTTVKVMRTGFSGTSREFKHTLNFTDLDRGILVKHSVRFAEIIPELWRAMSICSNVFHKHGYQMVITSANDSKHKAGSKHYNNRALDLRSKNIKNRSTKIKILEDMRIDLGPKYRVLFEGEGKPYEHYHMGFYE